MSALPKTFASSKPLPAAPGVESAKPVGSVKRQPSLQNHLPATRISSLFVLPREPEDARLTGGTRSLDRRLLALNLAGPRLAPAASAEEPDASLIA